MAARLLSVIFRSIDRKINSIFLPRITAHNYDDFACDLVPVAGSDIISENEKQEDSLSGLFDGFLWAAVPKSRRSRERRATRRFGITKIRDYMTPKRNIIACLECGHYHEAHTICVYRGQALLSAAQSGNVEEVRRLVEEGHSVNEGNFDLMTPLHEACLAGRAECVQELIKLGAQVNARNIDGATPLCYASHSGNIECVQLLMENGAEINSNFMFFTTPLHEAVTRNHVDVIKLLLTSGAQMEVSDIYFGRPLHVAAIRDNIAAARELLLAGALVNAAKNHETALHVAAANGSYEFCCLLLEFGANACAEDLRGRRPRHRVPEKSTQLAQLLLLYEGEPTSLLRLCRLAVRKHFICPGINIEEKLPKILYNYISFSNFSTGIVVTC